jgi:poly(3-hydroxybutyrate) depolymerase
MAAPLLRYPLLVPVALLVSVLAFRAAPQAQVAILHTVDRTSASTIRDRAPGYLPTYVVYADSQRTPEQAQALLHELGMMPHLEEYKTRAFVVGPVNGAGYDADADLAAFKEMLRTRRSSNLKIIGVGQGATFVNNVISGYAFAVAGILTHGGSIDARARAPVPVPAYVSAANPAVARLYRDANGATTIEENAAGYTAYRNPGQHERLQRVVVSKRGGANETLAEAFRNAWQTVFSRNYRLYMIRIESYKPEFDPNNYPEPWLLEPYVMYDRLRVRYEAVTEELSDLGLSLRYDSVPERALAAAPRSVPLVVMLHGNNNDPRIQGESSGWVEVAAEHTLILTSIEWQGRKAQGNAYAAIGEAGTMTLIDRLLAKYPQIDPGRVYFTGLSAGAMNSFSYGLRNITRIAAIAGASSPFGPPAVIELAAKAKAAGHRLPLYAIAGSRDEFRPLPVNETPRSFYNVIRSFADLNGITAPATPDLTANEMFGVRLDGPGWTELAGRRAMIGTLSNDQGVVIRLVALDPYAHWNFKPAAADMWGFLSRFRRDPATGALQVLPGR